MCKKLYELYGVSAEQILEICGSSSYPVDIQKILKTLGVKYAPMDFSETEKIIPDIIEKRGQILGAVTLIDDEVNIFYRDNPNDSQQRIRFTLAHELAHCCLNAHDLQNQGHIEFRFDEKTDMPSEIAANIFAGKLLIPEDALRKVYNQMLVPLSDVLAKEFAVSRSVMEARLKYLKLPFYSPTV